MLPFIRYFINVVVPPVGAVPLHVSEGVEYSHLVSYIGLFIIILVAGMLHVYPAPAERIALKRPMLTTGSFDTGDTKFHRFHFSLSASLLKSLYIVAFGNLAEVNLTVLSQLRQTRYTNISVSFVASSLLPKFSQLYHATFVTLNALVILLTTHPICTFTGFVGVGSLPS